jgi:hypothetical protein
MSDNLFSGLDLFGTGGTYSEESFVGDVFIPSSYEESSEKTRYELGLEALVDTYASLDNLNLLVRHRQNDGGLTKIEAALLNAGIDGMWNGVGVTRSSPAFSLEGFDSKSGRISETAYSLEKSIGATLKYWWQAIKDFIVKWINKAKVFYLKYISAIGRLPKNIDALKTKIEDSDNTEPDEKQLAISGKMFRNLTAEADVVGDDVITSGLKVLAESLSKWGKDSKAGEELNTFISELESLDFEKPEDVTKLFKISSDYKVMVTANPYFTQGIVSGDDRYKNNDDTKSTSSITYLGKKRMFMVINLSPRPAGVAGSPLFKSADISCADFKKTISIKDEIKVTPIAKGKMETVLDAAKEAAEAVLACKANLLSSDKDVSDLMKKCDDLYKKVDEAKTKEEVSLNVGTRKRTIAKGKIKVSDTAYHSVDYVKSILKTMASTVKFATEPQSSLITLAGASAVSAYDLTLMSFKNLKSK